jgi:hypothetical protein
MKFLSVFLVAGRLPVQEIITVTRNADRNINLLITDNELVKHLL